jgi:hypothetical protein
LAPRVSLGHPLLQDRIALSTELLDNEREMRR